MTGAPLARVTPEERIAELEKALAEQAAELERLRTALKQKDEALDAWKRGHRSRPGGKKAQRSTDSVRPKRAPGRAAGHAGCSRRAPAGGRVWCHSLRTPPSSGYPVDHFMGCSTARADCELSRALRLHQYGRHAVVGACRIAPEPPFDPNAPWNVDVSAADVAAQAVAPPTPSTPTAGLPGSPLSTAIDAGGRG
jgi:hypothetical protein